MQIPSGITVEIAPGKITVTGSKGKLSRNYDAKSLSVEKNGEEIIVKTIAKETRKGKAASKSIDAHLKNMFKGVQGDYEKKMKALFAHFPVSLEVKGDELIIKNFLGEKRPRNAKIVPGVTVKVSGQDIAITGIDKEKVGQTANNIKTATRITNKDRRVFQDGIYYA